jgi:hypothetical protein
LWFCSSHFDDLRSNDDDAAALQKELESNPELADELRRIAEEEANAAAAPVLTPVKSNKPHINVVFIGHVDHGKVVFTGNIPHNQLLQLQADEIKRPASLRAIVLAKD